MKKFSKLCVISIFLFFFLFSATKLFPGWFKHYGGSNNDYGMTIQKTSDGGFVVAGYADSYTYGKNDFAIYKLDGSGNKVWFKHYGGSEDDSGITIQQTSDGGFIIAGFTGSYSNGGNDFAIYKLDSSGNKVWFKHYGGTASDYAVSIQQTSDNGYIVAGYSSSFTYGGEDIAIYKLNSSGNKVWFKHYGGTANDRAYSIQQTSDGGYVVAGLTYSYTHGGSDYAIYRLDSSGSKIWFKHYGGSLSDDAASIQEISGGGYIVAGYMGSFTHGLDDFGIYKLDSSGNKVWFKHYGGVQNDGAYSIDQTWDNGYIVAGYTGSYTHGNDDFAIYKLDSSGNKVWFKHYGGTQADMGKSIQEIGQYTGIVVAGNTSSYTYGNSDFAIYKLDSDGEK